jgi:hypothetical protein
MHITPKREFIRNIRLLPVPVIIRGAFDKGIVCRFYGDGEVRLGEHILRVDHLVYCPQLRDTLLSHVRLLKAGHKFEFGQEGGTLTNKEGTFTVPVSYKGNVFTLGDESKREKEEANALTRSQLQLQQAANPIRVQQQTAPAARPTVNSRAPAAVEDAAVDDNKESTPEHPNPRSPPAVSTLAHARYGHACGRKLDQLLDSGAVDGLLAALRKHGAHKDLIRACESCTLSKMGRSAFGKERIYNVEAPNDMAVGDVMGPILTEAIRGEGGKTETVKISCSLVVDVTLYSRNVSLRFITRKCQASKHVLDYTHSSKLLTQRALRHFHADGGKEYNEAERILVERGVKVTRTPVHTPQHNGIAERKNRTLMDMARSLLATARLDWRTFAREAIQTAVYIHNRTNVVAALKKTQHESFTGVRPNVSNMRVFGCDAFVHIADPKRKGKLLPRAEKGTFIGYDLKREGCWKILVGDKIVVSRDVQFQENQFSVGLAGRTEARANSAPPPAALIAESESDTSSSSSDSGEEESNIDRRTLQKVQQQQRQDSRQRAAEELQQSSSSKRRSTREKKRSIQTGLNPDDFGQFALQVAAETVRGAATTKSSNLQKEGEEIANELKAKAIRESDVKIPATYRAAQKSPFSRYFLHAMRVEMESMQSLGVYTLTPRPAGVNVVGSKWVFSVKAKDGVVARFKARLVARGFSQQHGVDYEETYSPVMKYKTLRLLLAIVAAQDLEMELFDVITAYLNAPLKETVFMQQPEGFEQGGNFREQLQLVWLLLKAIYGLKQAGREWNTLLDSFVRSLGFTRCSSDTCLYMKCSRTRHSLYIPVYVDDIPSAFHPLDRDEWQEIKQQFFERFQIKFLGEADWLLNLRITRDRTRRMLWLDQQAYTERMLEDLGMQQCKPMSHPGTPEELTRAGCPAEGSNEQREMRAIPYRRAVGLLTYLSNTSRPDIAHAVNLTAQFAQNPGAIHWRAVQAILRYLCGTADYSLPFDGSCSRQHSNDRESPPTLTVYADASWGNCTDTGRSTTGWIIRYGKCWIDWNCHKQETVALSSCESEYMSISAATTSTMWTLKLLKEVTANDRRSSSSSTVSSELQGISAVPLLLSDNKSAIAIAKNDVHHNRSKHINIKHHFIREQLSNGTIVLDWISTLQQVADILTKTLQPRAFSRLRDVIVAPRGKWPNTIEQLQALQ